MKPLEAAVFMAITELENPLGRYYPGPPEIWKKLVSGGLKVTPGEVSETCRHLEESGIIERPNFYHIKSPEGLVVLVYCAHCGRHHLRRLSDGKCLSKSGDWVRESIHRNSQDTNMAVLLSEEDGKTKAEQLGLQVVN